MARVKEFIESVIPPIFKKDSVTARGNNWKGNYKCWEDALPEGGGYEEQIILEKCKSALLKVRSGEVPYERDSVVFNKIQYAWPLLACLERIALENKGCLHVVDFGGSLGSTYFQNRMFLKSLSSLKWIIAEQKHFVDCGKQYFQDETLMFEDSIEKILEKEQSNCLLLSSVIQYLAEPEAWITRFKSYDFKYILLDRTSFISDSSRLTIQTVPEQIYHASYPCWFFNENKFLRLFEDKYELVADFESFADPVTNSEDGKQLYWKGFFFKQKL